MSILGKLVNRAPSKRVRNLSTISKTPIYQIMAANTDVGKTIFSTALIKATKGKVGYLKPVQTGFPKDSDARHVVRYCGDGVDARVLFTYKDAVSPHLAAEIEDKPISDQEFLEEIQGNLKEMSRDSDIIFLETAGGVLSPGISGTSQADILRPLRLPIILIADYRLGGISATLSSLESLEIRGYDVILVLAFKQKDDLIANSNFNHLSSKLNVPLASIPPPPNHNQGEEAMEIYYDVISNHMKPIIEYLYENHEKRINDLNTFQDRAKKSIWWPFTQHQDVNQVTVIDSAHGDYYITPQEKLFDGAAAWWTNSLGHGNVTLSKALAKAAGRFGHVLFPENVHEPALLLTEELLKGPGKNWASRVFFTDDGSTASEVGIKMGLRLTEVLNGDSMEMLNIIGIDGAYHGDTIGAMDAASRNDYNALVNWYQPRGIWFQPPTILMKNGNYVLNLPKECGGDEVIIGKNWKDVFTRENSRLEQVYFNYISSVIKQEMSTGKSFGVLVLEPIILGAGGMLLVDPIFQRTLIKTCRNQLDKIFPHPLPVMYDEVFVGLHRLGPGLLSPGSTLLGLVPDIAIYAKALTGGTVPLSVTLATEEIFNVFKGPTKKEALLHGHSYTAHPIGCQVALTSLQELNNLVPVRLQDGGYEQHEDGLLGSVWPMEQIVEISKMGKPVEGIFAIGTVLAIHFQSNQQGYAASSTSPSRKICQVLRKEGIYARPLGNVVYLMSSMQTSREECMRILEIIQKIIRELYQ